MVTRGFSFVTFLIEMKGVRKEKGVRKKKERTGENERVLKTKQKGGVLSCFG